MAIFTGNDRENTINGGAENDSIFGLGDDDILNGGAGNDSIDGGEGDDEIVGGLGDDLLEGKAGNDSLEGGLGNDNLFGGLGNDSLSGGEGNDILKAYGGTLGQNSPSEFNRLTGGSGSDLFDLRDASGNLAYLNDDDLGGAAPKGFAVITDFQPDLNAGNGDKIQLVGNAAEYRLIPVSWGQKFGQEDTANIVDAALVYIGSEQDKQDVIAVLQDVSAQTLTNSDGFLKNSNLFVSNPNYVHPQPSVTPNPGNPGTGNPGTGNPGTGNPGTGNPGTGTGINRITGTPAADNLQGTAGTDLILGLGAKDSLAGGAGNDTLAGGAGKDTISGGIGTDQFVFVSLRDKGDRITDFNKLEGDKLVFDLDGFAGLKAGALKSSQFVKGKKALDRKDRLVYDQKKGKLFYDADGIGSTKQIEIATFGNKPALTASNILVVESPF
ncbi:MAG TPA: calcium-binding protein [Coleofasciculaceae cyanobacterium]|jgi:Ca2+-binding RTX toxin-like protein